ncbi:MAG: cysteine peptidase family C39 domain-containing protein [Oleiphilus sp.]
MGWENYTKAGRSFDVLIQEQEADCGLCCVAMIVNQKGQGKPSSSMVKNLIGKQNYQPSTKDRAWAAPSILTLTVTPTETHSSGTYLKSLQDALNTYGVKSTYCGPHANIQGAIKNATADQPIIAHVTWNSGAGHWVVITHSQGNSHYVLDPYYGLQINSDTTLYQGVEQGGTGPGSVQVATYGHWTGEWLKIS